MKNLIKFIFKYHFFILFLIIQFFSFFFVVQFNTYQKASFINSSNSVFAVFFDGYSSVTSYFSLKKTNKILIAENKYLHNLNISNYKSNKIKSWQIKDSIYSQQYKYNAAEVINNSTNKQRNYITLNKGIKHGILPEMAVISPQGVIGIIKESSKNYSVVIPILNTNLMISAKLKNSDYFGSVSWDGIDYRKCKLHDIPFHTKLNIGDSVVTSGYSAIFPKGIIIGTISNIEKPEGNNFYDIEILLATDFRNVSFVYVISNLLKSEQKNLENKIIEND